MARSLRELLVHNVPHSDVLFIPAYLPLDDNVRDAILSRLHSLLDIPLVSDHAPSCGWGLLVHFQKRITINTASSGTTLWGNFHGGWYGGTLVLIQPGREELEAFIPE